MARQQLQPAPPSRRRAGEVAGNATAECAAVCCCVPCTVMDIVVLAAYKVPAGLVKKAMRERKRSLQQKKMMKKKKKQKEENKEEALLHQQLHENEKPGGGPEAAPTREEHLAKDSPETAQLEAEMWDRFNGTGFWRSSSQRQQHEPEHHTGDLDR